MGNRVHTTLLIHRQLEKHCLPYSLFCFNYVQHFNGSSCSGEQAQFSCLLAQDSSELKSRCERTAEVQQLTLPFFPFTPSSHFSVCVQVFALLTGNSSLKLGSCSASYNQPTHQYDLPERFLERVFFFSLNAVHREFLTKIIQTGNRPGKVVGPGSWKCHCTQLQLN